MSDDSDSRMNTNRVDAERYARYQRVLDVLTNNPELPLAEVKSACAEEPPAFISRVVRESASDGFVETVGKGKHVKDSPANGTSSTMSTGISEPMSGW